METTNITNNQERQPMKANNNKRVARLILVAEQSERIADKEALEELIIKCKHKLKGE